MDTAWFIHAFIHTSFNLRIHTFNTAFFWCIKTSLSILYIYFSPKNISLWIPSWNILYPPCPADVQTTSKRAMCRTKTTRDPHVEESINEETAPKTILNFHGLMVEVSVNMYLLPENAQFLFLFKGKYMAMERLKPWAWTVFLELNV